MKTVTAVLFIRMLLCSCAATAQTEMDALYESMRAQIPSNCMVTRTDSGFILETKDSVWFYSGVNPDSDFHLEHDIKSGGTKQPLKLYVLIEKRWPAELITEAVALNDSVGNVLDSMIQQRGLARSASYWDYDWEGDEKTLFDKLRRVPTFSAGDYSVLVFDNRPDYYSSSLYPFAMSKQREEMLTVIKEKVFEVKVATLPLYHIYWGTGEKWQKK